LPFFLATIGQEARSNQQSEASFVSGRSAPHISMRELGKAVLIRWVHAHNVSFIRATRPAETDWMFAAREEEPAFFVLGQRRKGGFWLRRSSLPGFGLVGLD
jgi:hypothetical protein